ncbi:uncharacterized protein LOC133759431 [Lepus europaeus]|uniref:uncharacterized protein LOC133759431 n=1 Tax=Lepus europaeus TaxID=9983 RepID=UPI002B48D850|nr:uncharacterized protein LOC133759431 [Lepus europaeus]
MGAGAQGLGPSSTAFPGHSRERDQNGAAGTRTGAHMGCWYWLYCCATVLPQAPHPRQFSSLFHSSPADAWALYSRLYSSHLSLPSRPRCPGSPSPPEPWTTARRHWNSQLGLSLSSGHGHALRPSGPWVLAIAPPALGRSPAARRPSLMELFLPRIAPCSSARGPLFTGSGNQGQERGCEVKATEGSGRWNVTGGRRKSRDFRGTAARPRQVQALSRALGPLLFLSILSDHFPPCPHSTLVPAISKKFLVFQPPHFPWRLLPAPEQVACTAQRLCRLWPWTQEGSGWQRPQPGRCSLSSPLAVAVVCLGDINETPGGARQGPPV